MRSAFIVGGQVLLIINPKAVSSSVYPIEIRGLTDYEFSSVGHKGVVRKKVEIFPFPGYSDVYNFAFGDLREDGSLDDLAMTNNGDVTVVFATLFVIMRHFLNEQPALTLFFRGSTPQRNSVYQAVLKRHYPTFAEVFDIRCFRVIENIPITVSFHPEDVGECVGFLIKKL